METTSNQREPAAADAAATREPLRSGSDATVQAVPVTRRALRACRVNGLGQREYRCTKCGAWKTAEGFHALSTPTSSCGLNSWCRLCCNAARRALAADPDAIARRRQLQQEQAERDMRWRARLARMFGRVIGGERA